MAYICSRYYRAPELIFGSNDYSTAIDVWSAGCVLAELLLGSPLFPGSSGVDQLVEIIKVLGTPSKDELKAMNPNYQEFKFPNIKAHPLREIFPKDTTPESVDLVAALLRYVPNERCRAIEACAHTFFDQLRSPDQQLADGSPLSLSLFRFTSEEFVLAKEDLALALIPPHVRGAVAPPGRLGVGGASISGALDI